MSPGLSTAVEDRTEPTVADDAAAHAIDESTGEFPAWDGTPLHCVRVTPQAASAQLVVLHGYGDHSGRYMHLMRWMAQRGIACHAYDSRGHGRSGGKRGYVNRWDEYLDDLAEFLQHERLQPSTTTAADGRRHAPLFVLGHSHGGLVAAVGAIRGTFAARGVIFSSPYICSAYQVPLFWRGFARTMNWIAPAIRVSSGIDPDWITGDPEMRRENDADTLLLRRATPRWFVRMRDAQAEACQRSSELRMPLLAFIGAADRIADAPGVKRFIEATGSEDKTFIEMPDGRHELLRDVPRMELFERILGWMCERMTNDETRMTNQARMTKSE